MAYIALGSNLGNRRATIELAVKALRETPRIEVRRVSSIIQTDPVGSIAQGAYLNAVVEVSTSLSPRDLLDRCLAIERQLGRDRSPEQRWGPRTIDLDLLLYGEEIIDEPGLHVPHPRLHQRRFVLEPLAEIAPRLIHPVVGRSVECLHRELRSSPSSGGDA